jgi:hypothetical protein
MQAGLFGALAQLNEDMLGAGRGIPIHMAQIVAGLILALVAEVVGRDAPPGGTRADVVAAQLPARQQRQPVEPAQKSRIDKAGIAVKRLASLQRARRPTESRPPLANPAKSSAE